jgi:hypothetical protein
MARAARNDDLESCGLTYSELQELWLGPCNVSVFDTPEQLRDAWERGRAVVMRLWGSGGRRPQAWWAFEAPGLHLSWPGHYRERSYLYESGALSLQERAEVEREWRAAYDAAKGMGARERREAYEFADIPAELVERWKAERRHGRQQRAPSGEDPERLCK